ncbi:MAG: hypothetical protein IT321_19860 [Anaerolineae bacterium]|nr:hypothetical protein [Anaerolineae bacterium]
MRFLSPAKLKWLLPILLSLGLSLWHFGPLGGTLPALVIVVGVQVYGVGYLVARALGLWSRSESLVIRLMWVVIAGLGVTIVAGAVFRLLLIPLAVYIVALHGFMLALVFVPARVAPTQPVKRRLLPVYALLIFICGVYLCVGWERNHIRMGDYPDQTFPVSLANWWVQQPQPSSIISRNAADWGEITYWSTDGLTYVFAAWAWSSGTSAVQVIWYAAPILFIWLIPLAHFAVAYRVTKRRDTAAWAAGITLIFSLATINTPILLGGAWMYGQEAGFHLTSLRYYSTALFLPLVLFAFFTALRLPRRRYILLLTVMTFALALTHPRQLLVALTVMCAVLGLRVLVRPSMRELRRSVILGLAILPALAVPLWQFSNHLETTVTADAISEIGGVASISQAIIAPDMLLFHPFVVLALAFTVVAVLRVRRSLAAQYAVAAAVVMLVLSYVPPIFNLLLHVLGSYFGIHYVFELFYILPIGLVLGVAINFAVDWLVKHIRLHRPVLQGFVSVGFAAAAFITLTEPFPLTNSARDQLNALNQIQAVRDIQPFDQQLLMRLAALPVTGDKVVYLTDNRIASFVIESVPYAFVTGGRKQDNRSYAGSSRFFDTDEDDLNAPWLDSADIAFLQAYDVSTIVLPATNPRVPQIRLQPERFEPVDTVAGYEIFSVKKPLVSIPADELFAAMNEQFAADSQPRWDWGRFYLDRPANAAWDALITEWQSQPDSDLTAYGLAFTSLMADNEALDRWQVISASHPDFQFTEVYANLVAQNDPQAAVEHLYEAFTTSVGAPRVLAARALLTPPLFSLLTGDQRYPVIITDSYEPDTWANLMEWRHEDELRERAALLMNMGYDFDVFDWLNSIPELNRAPRDLVAMAAIRLKYNYAAARSLPFGDSITAESILQPATDFDWIDTHRTVYANDWSNAGNFAGRMYYALTEPTPDEPLNISPAIIAGINKPFILQPEVSQQGSQVVVSALLGDFTPALPPNAITVRVISADRATTYASYTQPLDIPAGTIQRFTLPLDLPPDAPTGTPALVIITVAHDDRIVYQTVELETMLP